jgi:hypothetical protein
LEAAITDQNSDSVEQALSEAWSVGLHPGFCAVFIELVEAPWHRRHEDIISAIQRLRCELAVPGLERAALTQHPYLEFDENFGLARKCCWALADIGTPVARNALERLALATNPRIVAYAEKRLARWPDELSRKRSGIVSET